MLQYSIRQVHKKLKDKSLKPTDVLKTCLIQTEKIKNLNAFITITNEKAKDQAMASNERFVKGTPQGLLDGIPIAVKDNFCTKHIPTTCASFMLKNFIAPYNATVVEKLEQNGALIIGKTNMDEFAMGSGSTDSIFGATKNIWGSEIDNNFNNENRIDYIAGGSSGGSAVAVASGAVFGALGSDTGGSTRLPAAYCGIVGLKPTYGLLSRYGLIPLVNSLDVPGILTRSVQDSVDMLNVLAGFDPYDSTTLNKPFNKVELDDNFNPKDLTIGIPKEYHCSGMSQEVLDIWSFVADLLENSGCNVKQVSLPNTQASISCYSIINQCEVASNMARYDGLRYGHRSKELRSTEELYAKSRSEAFNEVVRSRIFAGNYFLLQRNYNKYFLQALKVRRLIAEEICKTLDVHGVHILLTPTTLGDAPTLEDFTKLDNRAQCELLDFCTQPANMAGCPAITIPIKLSKKKLPLSIQLIGKNFDEQTLLNTAKWIESKVNFKHFLENNGK